MSASTDHSTDHSTDRDVVDELTTDPAGADRPHPAAPNAELFHETVGPGAGLVDRLHDRLSGRST